MNKSLKYIILSCITIEMSLLGVNDCFAQMKSSSRASKSKTTVTKENDNGDNKSSTSTPNTGTSSSGSSSSSSGSSTSSSSSSSHTGDTGIKVFDPFLDNHLKAPPDGIFVGKFGQPIKVVEEELRRLGAKNHSYAFGKYSKMVLSSYLITLNFDVHKRLGYVEIAPKPPLNSIEPKAKEYFIKLFTEGADMTQVGIILSGSKLELRFISPN